MSVCGKASHVDLNVIVSLSRSSEVGCPITFDYMTASSLPYFSVELGPVRKEALDSRFCAVQYATTSLPTYFFRITPLGKSYARPPLRHSSVRNCTT